MTLLEALDRLSKLQGESLCDQGDNSAISYVEVALASNFEFLTVL